MTEKKHIDVSVIEAYAEGSISLKQASIMLERTPRAIMRRLPNIETLVLMV